MEKTDNRLSRRNMLLIAGGGIAAASALVAAPFRTQIAGKARAIVTSTRLGRGLVSLAHAGYDEWEAQVGSTFALGGGTGLRLVGVRALPSGGTRPASVTRGRAFVAVFDPLGGQSLAGDLIYTANHGEYGPLPIYLSAASDPRSPGRMLAVFN